MDFRSPMAFWALAITVWASCAMALAHRNASPLAVTTSFLNTASPLGNGAVKQTRSEYSISKSVWRGRFPSEMRYAEPVVIKALVPIALLATALQGQVIRTVSYNLVRLDAALDSIVTADSPLEVLGEHFGLTEGPVWVKDASGGYLLFSDCAANVIYKWQPNAPLSVFLERSGFTGADNLNAGQQTIAGRLAILLIGSNGLALDPQGRLIITAMADRTLLRLEKDGTRTTLADRFEGKRFSGPNDVVVKSNGSIYFTDSINGLRGGGASPQRELPYNGFYLVKEGKVTLLGGDRDHSGDFPNGIALSPDEKTMYVTAGFRKTLAYDVLPDDTVA